MEARSGRSPLIRRLWTEADVPKPLYRRVWGPNQWPDLPHFRPVLEDYMEAMSPLSVEFTSLIAEALGLPTDAFHRFYEHPIDEMQHRLKVRRVEPLSEPSADA